MIKTIVKVSVLFAALLGAEFSSGTEAKRESDISQTLYTFTLNKSAAAESYYDEAMAVASLQGIINRKEPVLYILSESNARPAWWLELFLSKGKWLNGRDIKKLPDIDALFALADGLVKGAVIWDPSVPASMNVATTIAGAEDGVVFSPDFAEKFLKKWNLKVIKDLRGMFTGKETGSKKNDAYRWAIKHYLSKGLCSGHLLCLYEDPFYTREKGNIGYVITRDWAVMNRSFVYDLSPWGDETPADDPDQKMGTDLETYKIMLQEILKQTAGKQMTEVAGFFSASKYSSSKAHKSVHEGVPTEWETVYLISPYNCYQNTIARDCYNQSLHSQAPQKSLKQSRPGVFQKPENKTYICFLMADYDSSTPLYDRMPVNWADSLRGKIPLLWGIDPNLAETYPDIFEYLYSTRSQNDYFAADASAAGYMNPSRIKKEYLPLFIKHNQEFYTRLDMTLSPMVLDFVEPTEEVMDAFLKFSPDGLATTVMDLHDSKLLQEVKGGKVPEPYILKGPRVWKGMPVMELLNAACNAGSPEDASRLISESIPARSDGSPGFYFYRIIWKNPGFVVKTVELLKKKRPELDIEVADAYNFFRMYSEYHSGMK